MSWRIIAQKSVDSVITEIGTEDLDLLEKEIRKRYPFGERKYWPYKVWLSVVKETMQELKDGKPHPITPDDVRYFWRDE